VRQRQILLSNLLTEKPAHPVPVRLVLYAQQEVHQRGKQLPVAKGFGWCFVPDFESGGNALRALRHSSFESTLIPVKTERTVHTCCTGLPHPCCSPCASLARPRCPAEQRNTNEKGTPKPPKHWFPSGHRTAQPNHASRGQKQRYAVTITSDRFEVLWQTLLLTLRQSGSYALQKPHSTQPGEFKAIKHSILNILLTLC
jgi:hypothetical protein